MKGEHVSVLDCRVGHVEEAQLARLEVVIEELFVELDEFVGSAVVDLNENFVNLVCIHQALQDPAEPEGR